MRLLVLAALGAAFCGSAAAQMAGRVTLQSNYVVRGISITDGRPIGGLDLSYDFTSGIFLNGSTFGALADRDHPGLAGFIGDAGYARRLGLWLSADAGVTHTEYVGIGRGSGSTGYTEIYAGLGSRHFSARLYYSPDYYRSGVRTLYGELAGNTGLAAGIRLNAHVGWLGYLNAAGSPGETSVRYDWLVGVSRRFGAIDTHMSLSGGGPNEHYGYGAYYEPRFATAFIVGAGYAF